MYQGVPEQETVLPIQPCCVVRILRFICWRFAFWQERFSERLHPCMPTRRLCSDLIFYFRQVLLCGFKSLSIRFFSMCGFLFVPAILFFRGYGVGLTAGFLCYTYHWMGALFHLLVLLPGVSFICLALLFSSREAFRASRSLARTGHLDFKIYVMRFGFTLSLAFGAAVVDVITSVCFAGFFSF